MVQTYCEAIGKIPIAFDSEKSLYFLERDFERYEVQSPEAKKDKDEATSSGYGSEPMDYEVPFTYRYNPTSGKGNVRTEVQHATLHKKNKTN